MNQEQRSPRKSEGRHGSALPANRNKSVDYSNHAFPQGLPVENIPCVDRYKLMAILISKCQIGLKPLFASPNLTFTRYHKWAGADLGSRV